MRFVDTSVLIHAVSPAAEDAGKAQRALALLEHFRGQRKKLAHKSS
jgi:hypothetical protein